MFSEITRFFKKCFTKRNILLVLMIFSFSFASYEVSFAGEVNAPVVGGDSRLQPAAKTDAPASKVVDFASEGAKGIGSLVAILTSLVTLLLHPSWYNGSLFDIDVYLHEIWILVSNVVYLIFGVILIYIALMNIIGRGNDYEIKKQLPKFIVGILIVPFSWFIIQFVLSLSSVFAAAVLSLPAESFKNFEANKAFFDNVKVCTDAEINLGGGTGNNQSNGQASVANSFKCNTYQTVGEVLGKSGNGIKDEGFYGIMSIYTYGVLKLDQFNSVSVGQITSMDGIKNLMNLGLKSMMDVLFVAVYLILLFALFTALFVRGIQLWIYMMISPLFGLFYYFGGSIGKLGKLSSFNLTNFISLAMLPVYVAAALSFGVVFIAVVDHASMNTSKDGIWKNCTGGNSNQNCQMEVGGIKLTIKGATGRGTGSDGNQNGATMASNPLGYLIMQLFAIVVLWVGVMSALNHSKLTESVIKPFSEFGHHVGQAAMKLPTQIPIPIPGVGNLSVSGLPEVMKNISSSIDRSTTQGTDRFMKGNSFLKQFVQENSELYGKLRSDMNNNKNDQSTVISNVNSIISAHKDYKDVMSSPDAKAYLEKYAPGVKITDEKSLIDAIRKIGATYNNSTWKDMKPEARFDDIKSHNGTSTGTQQPQQPQSNNVNFTYNGGKYDFGNIKGIEIGTSTEGIKDSRVVDAIYGGFKGQFTEASFTENLTAAGITDIDTQKKIISQFKQSGKPNFFK